MTRHLLIAGAAVAALSLAACGQKTETKGAATPAEPPIERNIATSELAEPRSAADALFCTASTRFCIVAPRPTPTTAM